jgi:hypothetical protein
VRDLFGNPAPDARIDRGANAHLRPEDFPLRLLSDPTNRASGALRDTNDVVGSQGTFNTTFKSALPGQVEEGVTRCRTRCSKWVASTCARCSRATRPA